VLHVYEAIPEQRQRKIHLQLKVQQEVVNFRTCYCFYSGPWPRGAVRGSSPKIFRASPNLFEPGKISFKHTVETKILTPLKGISPQTFKPGYRPWLQLVPFARTNATNFWLNYICFHILEMA